MECSDYTSPLLNRKKSLNLGKRHKFKYIETVLILLFFLQGYELIAPQYFPSTSLN